MALAKSVPPCRNAESVKRTGEYDAPRALGLSSLPRSGDGGNA